MTRVASESLPVFTPRLGHYPAFLHACTLVNGRPPVHADSQRFFRVTPPSVHQTLPTRERGGLISRRPGAPRRIAVLVDRSDLPALEPGYAQPVKITVTRYSPAMGPGMMRGTAATPARSVRRGHALARCGGGRDRPCMGPASESGRRDPVAAAGFG